MRTIVAGLMAGMLVLSVASMASAQDSREAGGRKGHMGAGRGPWAGLNLTDDQKAKVKEIMQNAGAEMQKADTSASRQA